MGHQHHAALAVRVAEEFLQELLGDLFLHIGGRLVEDQNCGTGEQSPSDGDALGLTPRGQ